MDTYCLKCKRKTKNLNSKGFITKIINMQLNHFVKYAILKIKIYFKTTCQWILIKSLFQNTNIKSNNIIYELL